jgi:hypothetical protein
MGKQTSFLRRVSCAVVAAAMALAIGVPALAGDDDRPRDRVLDRDPEIREPAVRGSGVEWSGRAKVDPAGVEWTLLF